MRARKIDTSQPALVAYAKQLGFKVHLIGGTLDALLWHPHMGPRVYAVDFKSAGGTLTLEQQKLTRDGWPVFYVSTPEQLESLRRDVGGRKGEP